MKWDRLCRHGSSFATILFWRLRSSRGSEVIATYCHSAASDSVQRIAEHSIAKLSRTESVKTSHLTCCHLSLSYVMSLKLKLKLKNWKTKFKIPDFGLGWRPAGWRSILFGYEVLSTWSLEQQTKQSALSRTWRLWWAEYYNTRSEVLCISKYSIYDR